MKIHTLLSVPQPIPGSGPPPNTGVGGSPYRPLILRKNPRVTFSATQPGNLTGISLISVSVTTQIILAYLSGTVTSMFNTRPHGPSGIHRHGAEVREHSHGPLTTKESPICSTARYPLTSATTSILEPTTTTIRMKVSGKSREPCSKGMSSILLPTESSLRLDIDLLITKIMSARITTRPISSKCPSDTDGNKEGGDNV